MEEKEEERIVEGKMDCGKRKEGRKKRKKKEIRKEKKE